MNVMYNKAVINDSIDKEWWSNVWGKFTMLRFTKSNEFLYELGDFVGFLGQISFRRGGGRFRVMGKRCVSNVYQLVPTCLKIRENEVPLLPIVRQTRRCKGASRGIHHHGDYVCDRSDDSMNLINLLSWSQGTEKILYACHYLIGFLLEIFLNGSHRVSSLPFLYRSYLSTYC